MASSKRRRRRIHAQRRAVERSCKRVCQGRCRYLRTSIGDSNHRHRITQPSDLPRLLIVTSPCPVEER